MRLLFQGDSITAGARGEAVGYPVFVEQVLKEKYPNEKIEFVNRAVWGNRLYQLKDRLQEDVFDVNPDFICLMIGVNNALNAEEKTPPAMFAKEYEELIREIKEKTGATLFLIQPYIFENEPMRKHNVPLLKSYHPHIERVAKMYAQAYLPLHEIMAGAPQKYDVEKMTVDGLHLSKEGARLVAELCLEKITTIVEQLLYKERALRRKDNE